ncbi:hypothetical protein ISR94_01460 [Candidatus Microgenomates bacterium]|nr:hypothetical protein [Candidatus Microgenomates bacterium]
MPVELTQAEIKELQEQNTRYYKKAKRKNRLGIELSSIKNSFQRQNTKDYLLVANRNRIAPISRRKDIAGTASERDQ